MFKLLNHAALVRHEENIKLDNNRLKVYVLAYEKCANNGRHNKQTILNHTHTHIITQQEPLNARSFHNIIFIPHST